MCYNLLEHKNFTNPTNRGVWDMNNKKFTVAIIGLGARGAESYGRLMHSMKDKFEITALCDVDELKLEKYGKIFETSELFNDETEFFKQKRADALVIATLDRDHVRQCERALELKYDVLLEKPITDDLGECEMLLNAHKKYGGKVVVCHVLRYAPAFIELKKVLDSGECGELVMIDTIEQVSYWHQAHSFVRGNWRNREQTSPMILQKCCHDLDLLQYYANSKCETLSSIGDLKHFKKSNQPEGAADRCEECKYVDECCYSARGIYIGNWKAIGSPDNCWPYNMLTTEYPLTEENIRNAIKTGPYGRCVYACDNDVVDHQIVSMTFENGVKANLRMTAFTQGGGRIMKFYCTKGEFELDEATNIITVRVFSKPDKIIDVNALIDKSDNHGGGDAGLIKAFYETLCGRGSPTALESSVESHIMALKAEQSRLKKGELLKVHD